VTRVVEVSNCASFEGVAVMKFLEALTRNLLAQEAGAGVTCRDLPRRGGAEESQQSGGRRLSRLQ
jgi:hypothetical protein